MIFLWKKPSALRGASVVVGLAVVSTGNGLEADACVVDPPCAWRPIQHNNQHLN